MRATSPLFAQPALTIIHAGTRFLTLAQHTSSQLDNGVGGGAVAGAGGGIGTEAGAGAGGSGEGGGSGAGVGSHLDADAMLARQLSEEENGAAPVGGGGSRAVEVPPVPVPASQRSSGLPVAMATRADEPVPGGAPGLSRAAGGTGGMSEAEQLRAAGVNGEWPAPKTQHLNGSTSRIVIVSRGT